MIISTLLPPQARPRLVPFAVLVVVAAALRATSALALVPLLGALFSPVPQDALAWLGLLAASVAAGWALAGLFDLGDRVGHILMGLFSLVAAWIMLQLWRRATSIEPLRDPPVRASRSA